jgi:hypothetical protein
VTEILDRHIDAGDKTGNDTKTGNDVTKRKRISFNVPPAIALTPSEEIDDEEEDYSQQQSVISTKT